MFHYNKIVENHDCSFSGSPGKKRKKFQQFQTFSYISRIKQTIFDISICTADKRFDYSIKAAKDRISKDEGRRLMNDSN